MHADDAPTHNVTIYGNIQTLELAYSTKYDTIIANLWLYTTYNKNENP